jgi:tripartite-type tricarboxylate transporter receptor subunit TctC
MFVQGCQRTRLAQRTIRWVLPYPAGGTSDVLTRLLAQHLGPRLGQQVVVDNKPGANGLIGTDVVAKAAPDGYTMVIGVIGPLTVLPHLVKMPYDPLKDLAPVTMLASVANVVVVRKDSPYKSLTELMDAARARPGEVTFGSVGVGSSGQLSAGLLGGMAGVKFSNIGYSGGAPAMVDLLGGRLDFMFDNAPTSAPRVRSGELRALAITSSKRSPVMRTCVRSPSSVIRVRRWFVVWRPGSGEDAAADHRSPQPRTGRDPQGSGRQRATEAADVRPDAFDAGGVRGFYRQREPQVGQGHQGQQHQGRLRNRPGGCAISCTMMRPCKARHDGTRHGI